jgi:diphthamide synthase subunit DPH2
MTNILSLPVEILRHCVGYLDTAALKRTRLISRAFRDIATEVLFDVATLRVTKESAERLTTLIKKDDLRHYIRTVSVPSKDYMTPNQDTDEPSFISIRRVKALS